MSEVWGPAVPHRHPHHSPIAGLVDSHMHTTFSCDARATMVEMVEQAIRLGLSEITFTDHLDLDPGDRCRDYLRTGRLPGRVGALSNVYADRIMIRAGLEVATSTATGRRSPAASPAGRSTSSSARFTMSTACSPVESSI